jgi:hypothetical protein
MVAWGRQPSNLGRKATGNKQQQQNYDGNAFDPAARRNLNYRDRYLSANL